MKGETQVKKSTSNTNKSATQKEELAYNPNDMASALAALKGKFKK
jgi:hypothetical protein